MWRWMRGGCGSPCCHANECSTTTTTRSTSTSTGISCFHNTKLRSTMKKIFVRTTVTEGTSIKVKIFRERWEEEDPSTAHVT